MWRDDHLYDIVVVTSHNQRPRVKGLGSAIFVHVAASGLTPTEGCVALDVRHLRQLLSMARAGVRLRIG